MQDTEIIIREALSRYPAPRAAPSAVSDIVMRSVASTRITRPRWVSRAILVSYWICALVGTLAILMAAPTPEWTPSALTALVAWTVPVLGVLVLYGKNILKTFAKWSSHYLSTP